jgi:hypothetical protein
MFVAAPTVEVVMGKPIELAPGGTCTNGGTTTAAELLANVTVAGALCAGMFIVTTPPAVAPPMTVVGVRTRLERASGGAGKTWINPVIVVPPVEALTPTLIPPEGAGPAVIGKEAVSAP